MHGKLGRLALCSTTNNRALPSGKAACREGIFPMRTALQAVRFAIQTAYAWSASLFIVRTVLCARMGYAFVNPPSW